MRPLLTVASSLTPSEPWWDRCSVPSEAVTSALHLVLANMARSVPKSGVAVVIRVTGPVDVERVLAEQERLLAAFPRVVARAATMCRRHIKLQQQHALPPSLAPAEAVGFPKK